MSKLAIYEKRFADSDRKLNEYFRSDYVYKKNVRTRFFVFLGCLIILCFYITHKIVVDKAAVLSLDFMDELRGPAVFTVCATLFYTFLSWAREAANYNAAMDRLKIYGAMLGRLDKLIIRQSEEANADDAAFADAGSDS
jgi:hypothetical protein